MKNKVLKSDDDIRDHLLNKMTNVVQTARRYGVTSVGMVGSNDEEQVISVAVICTDPIKAKRIAAILDEKSSEEAEG